MAKPQGTDEVPRGRRDVHRRLSSTTWLFSAISFVLGAVVSPTIGAAVDRWVPGGLQKVDDVLGNSPLYVSEKYWPRVPCSGDGTAAVMPDGPAPELHLESSQGANPYLLIDTGVAVPWQKASLQLLLSATRPGDVLLIEGIKPKVYEYKDQPAAWTVTPPVGACGHLDARILDLTLARGSGTIVDKGATPDLVGKPLPPEVPVVPPGDAFTVAQNDAAALTIHVSPKDGYYEFGLEVIYSLNGESRIAVIGTPEDPYRAAGGKVLRSFKVDEAYRPIN